MKLYMLKALGLAAIMFALALGGMQAANDGISRIKGYGEPEFKQPVSLEKEGHEDLTVGIMGSEVATIRLNERGQQIEDTEGINVFSSIGKALTSILSGAVKGIIDFFSK
ncbi:DUF3679 domain-containing protein [Bacillus sp. FJAT-27245]|uniref:DUF3679 domain-containing protein n=1 Tax=Bacillus sp. FJAT-27245 TaxID=1684144 RepID=UPI0006A7A7AA|nr:DUF3679 domain-containing protein [Bacillus sp. FJAT-27245]